MNQADNRIKALADRLPEGFLIGSATSSWQIEGDLAGRGSSIWEDFAKAGKIKDGSTGEPACDHVNRVEGDLELLSWLGIDSYRFSFSWPRIMRTGEGALNPEGLDFYDRLIDGLLERGIKPAATVYHWDLPSTFGDKGGWCWEPIADKFADYASVLATKFADRVDSWATLNEPWVSSFLGYATDIHAPGANDPAKGFESAYRLLLAHGRGIEALRSNGAKNTGLVLNLTTMIADDEGSQKAASLMDGLQNRLFLDPVAGRGIPEDVMEATQHITDWAFVKASELKEIATPIDWLGINYYTPNRVESPSANDKGFIVGQNTDVYPGMPAVNFVPREPRTDMGWEIHAPSMTTTLIQTAERLPGVPLFITENGGAFKDDKIVDGRVQDDDRVDYYINHLNAVLDAKDQGVDVRGYFAWSLLDNLEWAEGWKMTFGIVHVDKNTQVRTPKASAEMFKKLIELR
jgi:beta-glucosidase